ncbi:DUF4136 domain-containing protein [Nonlabens xiamenensis]|uniref:DUF4136 domain-containing protein n=1 Tax=Nonlabens xiamenensis TaxID=2341043 RepID=UPI0013DE5784|nr:DUF4136 domain-containing protein [Nonlabens xiamenensis]
MDAYLKIKNAKKIFKTLTLLLIAVSLTACGPTVSTIKSASADLDSYQTFAYLPNAELELPDREMKDRVNSLVVETINENMMDEGYRLDRDNPDLLVLVSTQVDQETETEVDPVYASYGFYNTPNVTVSPYYNNYYFTGYRNYNGVVGYEKDTYQYKEGTLVVQLVDRETKNNVWRGVSSDAIYDIGNIAAMNEMVNAIFEEYPLKK